MSPEFTTGKGAWKTDELKCFLQQKSKNKLKDNADEFCLSGAFEFVAGVGADYYNHKIKQY